MFLPGIVAAAGKALAGAGGAAKGAGAATKKTAGRKIADAYKQWTGMDKEQDGRKQAPAKQELDLSPRFGGSAPSMKKGGRVRKTGLYFLHKNEHVVPTRRSPKKGPHKRVLVKL
jgi:hypothetical protein